MSYKYRNGSTPDHVDSSYSDTSYPHTGIPIAAADATRVAKADFGKIEGFKKQKSQSDSDAKDASDYLSGRSNGSGGTSGTNASAVKTQLNESRARSAALDDSISATMKKRK